MTEKEEFDLDYPDWCKKYEEEQEFLRFQLLQSIDESLKGISEGLYRIGEHLSAIADILDCTHAPRI